MLLLPNLGHLRYPRKAAPQLELGFNPQSTALSSSKMLPGCPAQLQTLESSLKRNKYDAQPLSICVSPAVLHSNPLLTFPDPSGKLLLSFQHQAARSPRQAELGTLFVQQRPSTIPTSGLVPPTRLLPSLSSASRRRAIGQIRSSSFEPHHLVTFDPHGLRKM